MTDEELLRLIARKDPTAFREWYDRHSQSLYAYALRLLRDPQAAEDVLSEAMLAVWFEAARFRGDCQPRTWLYRIARNKAIELLRRRPADPLPLTDGVCGPWERDQERVDLRVTLEQALHALPPDQREVVELAFFHDLPYQEIARILDCPVNTVKTRMVCAKRKLRHALSPSEEAESEGLEDAP